MNKCKINVLLLLFLSSLLLPTACSSMDKTPKGPTAIVIDEETGKPIEGAVAIAIWRKNKITEGAWFEGGREVPVRIEEVVSDKEGRLCIQGFWNWHLYDNRYPRLTVYKFGYVCWDQEKIFMSNYKWQKRTDFNRNSQIVRLKKWQEIYLQEEQLTFIRSIMRGDEFKTKDQLFFKELWNK